VVAHLTSNSFEGHPCCMHARHRRSRLAWCLARRGWNLRTWRKIHWSDENRFLLHATDGRKYSLYPKEHPANCPSRWRLSNGLGCISHDCKLDLVTIQGNLTGDQYISISGRRLHEAEIGSRLTNGSCAMSLNSNHVVLSTMPNVIVDVGLPTVNV
jgi:hypothetical protein